MTPKLAQQLFLYRNLLVAIGNGGITWIILIIAPLGLFAVILNTALVFGSSLIFGVTADRLLKNVLKSGGVELLSAQNQPSSTASISQQLPSQDHPRLP